MELMEFDHAGSGCEDEDWGLSSSGFLENCSNQLESQEEESIFGLSELVGVTAVCILLMLLGILGNMSTILVVWLRPHMRSSTYLYLSSMAVSDLLILLLLPLDLYKLWKPRPWPLGDVACKLTMFLSECCTFSTILHITFLSLERYMGVCWPILAKTIVTRRRTKALIGCLWLGAVLSAMPVLLMVGVEDVGQEEGWVEMEVQGWEKRAEDRWTGSRGVDNEGRLTQGFASVAWEGEVDWGSVGGEVEGGGEVMKGCDGGGKQNESGNMGETGLSAMARGGGEADEGGGDGGRKKREPGRAAADAETNEQTMRREEGAGRGVTQGDNIECRCTDYAVSSGLMSAMMILSNLYFLVSLGILAVVYSLIGRTLLLRPPSSRSDQSHRHTIKMLGVIVLVFILCWLPFHIGRTIFSFSLGSVGGPDVYTGTHTDTQGHSDSGVDNDTSEIGPHVQPYGDGPPYTVTEAHGGRHLNTGRHADTSPGAAYTSPPTATITDVNYNLQTATTNYSMQTQMDTYMLYYLAQYFNLVSFVLFYLSAAVNPLLYNLMSARYRHAVRSLVRSLVHVCAGSGSDVHARTLPTTYTSATM